MRDDHADQSLQQLKSMSWVGRVDTGGFLIVVERVHRAIVALPGLARRGLLVETSTRNPFWVSPYQPE